MSHGDIIKNATSLFSPFKKAIKNRNKQSTFTLSTWPVEAHQVDTHLYRLNNNAPLWTYFTEQGEKHKAYDKVRKSGNELEHQQLERIYGRYEGSKTELVWGSMFCPYEHLNIPVDGTEPTQEQYKTVINFNNKVIEEMRLIGINAITIEDGMFNPELNNWLTRLIVFVPNAKVIETEYPAMPLTTQTDNKSRELMLAYLLHKGFIKPDDPAIAETFPFNAQHVKNIDIESLLKVAEESVHSPSF